MQYHMHRLRQMTGFVFRNQLETIRHFGVFQTAIDRDHHEFVGVRDVMHS